MGRKLISRLKKTGVLLLMISVVFSGYVWIITVDTHNMTIRQRILKTIYPAYTWLGRKLNLNNKTFINDSPVTPPVSLYDLSVVLNNGVTLPLSEFRGKKLLLVNTASDCGYTDQYNELQELYEQNRDRLTVIGFPANDFKQQEQKSDEEIAAFCRLNYGVSFPLAKKSSVIPGPDQHPVFHWLTDKTRNGWTNKKPSWNFSKYLVNEEGILIGYFGPSISPLGSTMLKEVNK